MGKVMDKEFLTLADVNVSGKRVLVRLDLNSPMDPMGKILDSMRFYAHLPTLRSLRKAKVVALAHQSRAGKNDFTTMEPHAKLLGRLLGRPVRYVDDIFGSHARAEISTMSDGDILLMENTRFYSEETLNRTPEEHSTTHMVRRLAPLFDMFVNDAFSVAHRSQLSVVGFTPVLPSVAGNLMEREVISLKKALENPNPALFVLGGVKPEDSLRVAKNVLSKNPSNRVALVGLIANLCLMAKGLSLGSKNEDILKSLGMLDYLKESRELLDDAGDRILLPLDFAVDNEGERQNISVSELPAKHVIKDIGDETISLFSDEISTSNVVVMNGPAGVIESEQFKVGTLNLLKAATEADYSVIGGGHISAAARDAGVLNK
ncbi:MAG: phosphoglycerate kinase, partial [Methermicoccaceae archaeon]